MSPSTASAASAAPSCARPSSARPTSRSSPSTTSAASQPRATAAARQRLRPLRAIRRRRRRRPSSSTAAEIAVLAGSDPATSRGASWAPRWSSSRPASFRTRAAASRHLDAGARKVILSAPAKGAEPADAERRPRRQLRRGLRRRAPPHHHQRVVHDQLPRTGRQGAARDRRHPPRPDDHDPRLHRRPAPARRAAQGPAARPRRGRQPRADLDRRGEGARPRHPRAGRQAERLRGPRADADGLARRPHDRGRAARPPRRRSTPPSPRPRRPAPLAGILAYSEEPIVSGDIVQSPATRRSSTRR